MNLKAIRKKLKLTQAQAARLAGVTVTTWCRWETGRNKPVNSHRLDLLQSAAATATKPCRLSFRWIVASGVTLDHLKKCPRCMLSWVSGGLTDA